MMTNPSARANKSNLMAILLAMVLGACNQSTADNPDVGDENDASTDGTDDDSDDDSDDTADEPDRPDGWGDETHGKDADPQHDTVFPADEVGRLDIEISAEDWQLMLDDMTQMAGQFGDSGGGVEIPDAALTACEGLAEGDPCEINMRGMKIDGTCSAMPGMGMVCVPMQSGADPKEACAGKQVDDSCTFKKGPQQSEGSCLLGDEGVLVCTVQQGSSSSGSLDKYPQDPVWVPCTVRFGDTAWWHVGIRFKGNSTLSNTWESGSYKLPFKLDFDQYEDQYPEVLDQRFFGFKRLAFANNAIDESYLRDKVTGDLLREGGVPAPRRAFYRIFLDVGEGPVYFGLYTMAEIPGRPMFLDQFGEKGGNLYKPDQGAATWKTGLPVDEESFPKKTNEQEADWTDVEGAIAALHADSADAKSWREGLEQVFDVDGFLRWLAINTVIQDWDTYGNLAHNYYLYGDPTHGGRLTWIPWDHNMSLSAAGGIMPPLFLNMSSVGDEWPLIRLLFDDPLYQASYWSHVEEFTSGVFDLKEMTKRLTSEHDLIAPYVTGEMGEGPDHTALKTPQSFTSSLQSLINHVEQRQSAVDTTLALVP